MPWRRLTTRGLTYRGRVVKREAASRPSSFHVMFYVTTFSEWSLLLPALLSLSLSCLLTFSLVSQPLAPLAVSLSVWVSLALSLFLGCFGFSRVPGWHVGIACCFPSTSFTRSFGFALRPMVAESGCLPESIGIRLLCLLREEPREIGGPENLQSRNNR